QLAGRPSFQLIRGCGGCVRRDHRLLQSGGTEGTLQPERQPNLPPGRGPAVSARIGVVGCGWWATYAHLPALESNDRAVIAGLAASDPARLAAAAERFRPERTFSSAEDMLSEADPDGVIIAVPHAAHHPMAKLALEHDVHVLVEKPMVIKPEHGHELVALAHERHRELIVGYPLHYNPQAHAL